MLGRCFSIRGTGAIRDAKRAPYEMLTREDAQKE